MGETRRISAGSVPVLSDRNELGSRGVAERDKLVLSQVDLPRRIARHYRRQGIDPDDLAQDGQIGLIQAAHRYRADKSPDFAGFAALVISREIREAVSKHYGMSSRRVFLERARQLDAKLAELRGELGREPTLQELAQATGRGAHRIRWDIQAKEAANTISLDAPSEEGDKARPVWERVRDRQLVSPEVISMAKQELRLRMNEVREELAWLSELEPMPRETFCLRYGLNGSPEPMCLEEVGASRRVSKNAVHQMLGRIWRKRMGSGQTEERLEEKLARIRQIAELLGEEVIWRLGQ